MDLLIDNWQTVVLGLIIGLVFFWCQDKLEKLDKLHTNRLIDNIVDDIKKDAVAVWHVPRQDEDKIREELERWRQDHTYVPIIRL